MAVLLALVATAGWGDAPPPTPRKEPARRPRTKTDTLAQRLCDALHTLPAARKKECCGATLSSLARVCTQELSTSLGSGAVTLDPAQIDRCAVQTAKQLEERQVGGGDRFVEPILLEEFFMLRVPHERQVRVQDEQDITLHHSTFSAAGIFN